MRVRVGVRARARVSLSVLSLERVRYLSLNIAGAWSSCVIA